MKTQLRQCVRSESLGQLCSNLEELGFELIFPVQKLMLQVDTSQNIFVQSPCGSGKTLASILPFIKDDTPVVVVYITPNELLKDQVLLFFRRLFHTIDGIRVLDSELDVLIRPKMVNRKVFIVTTVSNLELLLLQAEENQYIGRSCAASNIITQKFLLQPPKVQTLQLHNRIHFVIDEADKQIRENNHVFKGLFHHLNSLEHENCRVNVNDSYFSTQLFGQGFQFIFLSATLKLNQQVFNNLNVSVGQVVQSLEAGDGTYALVNCQNCADDSMHYFRILFTVLSVGYLSLPSIVFFEGPKQLKAVCKHFLNVAGIDSGLQSVRLNILNDNLQDLSGDYLNINQPVLGSTISFALDQYARGFDSQELKSVVSVGRCEKELLIHRLGRAGRGNTARQGLVLSTNDSGTISAVAALGQLQVFSDFSQFKSEQLTFSDDRGSAVKKADDIMRQYEMWWAENKGQQASDDLYDIIRNMYQNH